MQKIEGTEAESPIFITALARGVEVLRALAVSGRPLSLAEIASAAGVNRSAAQRIIHTFERLGLVTRGPIGRGFMIGVGVLPLAAGHLQASDLVRIANPFLHALFGRFGESCHLAVPYGRDMVFVIRFAATGQLSAFMPQGIAIPMHASASGKAYLSALPGERLQRWLAAAPLQAFTPHTLTDGARLQAAIAEARQSGIACADGEFFPGDRTIATPVMVGDRCLGAVSLSGPESRWSVADLLDQAGPALREAAQAIGQSLRPESVPWPSSADD
jgi:IclR family pca regulon transcriptional regulator